jgi:hypothetical protein
MAIAMSIYSLLAMAKIRLYRIITFLLRHYEN